MAQPRDSLFLPTDQSPGQMMGTWSIALSVAAYDIGVRIDGICKKRIGPGWARALEDIRRQDERAYRVNTIDPSWVFSEPAKRNSPIADILPAGAPDLFRKVSRRRNDWFHKNSPWDLDELDASLEILQDAVRGIPEIRAHLELQELAGHLFELRQRGQLPTEAEVQLQQAVKELEAERTAAVEQLREALGKLKELEGRGIDSSVVRNLESEMHAARERADKLARRIRDLEKGQPPDPDTLLPVSLRPGDLWPADVPLGTKRLRLLKAPQDDLVDPATGRFLSQTMGPHIRHAAERWRIVMPLGGDIHVTKAWNSAGLVLGRMTYLGRLDEAPEQATVVGAPVAELLLPYSYRYTGSDVLEARTGKALSSYLGRETFATVLRHIGEAVAQARAQGCFNEDELAEIDEGELDLRVSPSGHVVTTMDDQRGYLFTVARDEWFPRGG